MSFGLSKSDTDYIVLTLNRFPEVEKAMIFGSRAIGNYKKGSDVDIAVIGEKVNFSIIAKLKPCYRKTALCPICLM
jgi:predicted nucleotidyltransferase